MKTNTYPAGTRRAVIASLVLMVAASVLWGSSAAEAHHIEVTLTVPECPLPADVAGHITNSERIEAKVIESTIDEVPAGTVIPVAGLDFTVRVDAPRDIDATFKVRWTNEVEAVKSSNLTAAAFPDCTPPKPEPIVGGESLVIPPTCDNPVETTRNWTVTTDWVLEEGVWIKGVPVVSDSHETTRDVTPPNCPVSTSPPTTSPTPPACTSGDCGIGDASTTECTDGCGELAATGLNEGELILTAGVGLALVDVALWLFIVELRRRRIKT